MTALPSVVATNQDLDPSRLREAFGIFPTGVVSVAAEIDGEPVGLAASSFTSVSLEPPLVLVSLGTASKTWPQLRRADHLGVTILAEHHGAACRQLAGPVEQRFDGIAHTVEESGAVTLDEGLARFDCTIYREVEAGDHVLVLLELHEVRHVAAHAATTPLVFHRSAFGKLENRP